MIALFTDFGAGSPYTGQIRLVLAREAPGHTVIDLMHDAPASSPRPSALLLAHLADRLPEDAVVLAVVDPSVGSSRAPCVVTADRRRFVGPDNGLFEFVMRRASEVSFEIIRWKPRPLSDTFHGRDLFAPVVGRLAAGGAVATDRRALDRVRREPWPDDLGEIVYIDRFGNAMTGIRANGVDTSATVRVAGRDFRYARIYAEAGAGSSFWYENSFGLLEVAVAGGSAAGTLGLQLGMEAAVI